MNRNIYDYYFSKGDLFDGLGKVMYDISRTKISEKDLIELADELVSRGEIPINSNFEKKKWWAWSRKYVDFLMHGLSTGRASKEYLLFYFKVSSYVKYKGYIVATIIAIAILLAVYLGICANK